MEKEVKKNRRGEEEGGEEKVFYSILYDSKIYSTILQGTVL